jgi:hypothetical protein
MASLEAINTLGSYTKKLEAGIGVSLRIGLEMLVAIVIILFDLQGMDQ